MMCFLPQPEELNDLMEFVLEKKRSVRFSFSATVISDFDERNHCDMVDSVILTTVLDNFFFGGGIHNFPIL